MEPVDISTTRSAGAGDGAELHAPLLSLHQQDAGDGDGESGGSAHSSESRQSLSEKLTDGLRKCCRRDCDVGVHSDGGERDQDFDSSLLSFTDVEAILYSVAVGLFCGFFTAAFIAVLKSSLRLVWTDLPTFLHSVGWTQESVIPLQAFVPLCALACSLTFGLSLLVLPPPVSVNTWIDAVHSAGRAPVPAPMAMMSMSIVSICSGCSVGPEGVMIVIGGGLSGWFADTFICDGIVTTRWFSLIGASACVSAFFGMPFAGCIFVLSMLHKSGEPQHFEAMKGCLIASLVCCAVSHQLQVVILGEEEPYTEWVTPEPSTTDTFGALLAGILFGIIGAGLAALGWAADKATGMMSKACSLSKVACLVLVAAVFGSVGYFRPAVLFWGEEELAYIVGSTRPLPFMSSVLGRGQSREALGAWDLIYQGCLKVVITGMCKQAGFPGGIIYPLLLAGAAVGMGIEALVASLDISWIGALAALAPASIMASTQSSVNKTPWASLVLVLNSMHVGGWLPSTFAAVGTAVFVSNRLTRGWLDLFPAQRPRALW